MPLGVTAGPYVKPSRAGMLDMMMIDEGAFGLQSRLIHIDRISGGYLCRHRCLIRAVGPRCALAFVRQIISLASIESEMGL